LALAAAATANAKRARNISNKKNADAAAAATADAEAAAAAAATASSAANTAAAAAAAAAAATAAGTGRPCALLLFVTNDLRAVPHISHGRHIGAIKNACHVCKVESMSREDLATGSACYVDAVRHLQMSKTLLLVKMNGAKLIDGTPVTTHQQLRDHFEQVFANSPALKALAKLRRPAEHTHKDMVDQGRRFEENLASLAAGGVPDADLFPVAGVPGLNGTPAFHLVKDNLSDPMHMIMNNMKDLFHLLEAGLTKALKKSETVSSPTSTLPTLLLHPLPTWAARVVYHAIYITLNIFYLYKIIYIG
jgi:hypothetical protein